MEKGQKVIGGDFAGEEKTLEKLLFLVVAFLLFSANVSAQTIVSKKDLPNFYRVDSNLYRGAQPSEAGIKDLAAMGIKTIIDLRGADERAKREEDWARAVGINFINVSLADWSKPKHERINEILAKIDAAKNQPVFIHCRRSADRTGTVIAAYRIRRNGWTAKQAIAEAKTFGFGWWQFWMKDFIEDYYDAFIAQKQK